MVCKHQTTSYSDWADWGWYVECMKKNWRFIRGYKLKAYKHLTPPDWCPGFEPVEPESDTK